MLNNALVEVAVGVVVRDREVLLAKRPEGKHLSGYWEFPGGKLDVGETARQALAREFKEELGIDVDGSRADFLFDITFEYPHKTVKLIIFRVDNYVGEPIGLEGQEVRWSPFELLCELTFPPANTPILDYIAAL